MHDLDLIRQTKTVGTGDFASLNQSEPNPERTFKIGGRTFTFRTKIAANLIARFYDSPEAITPVCPHCGNTFNVGSPRPQQDALAAADALILSFLDPEVEGQADAWTAVRADDAEDPLTILEVMATGNYLLGALTARPTGQQSDSSSTRETAGTNSTEPLRSPAQV